MTDQREIIVERIERALREAFDQLNGQGAPEPVWTSMIKDMLCDEARRLNFKRAASTTLPNGRDFGEWLFDLVWLDYREEKGAGLVLKSIPLIVESEWGNEGDVEDDFEKLMVGRAIVKLLIFDGRDGALDRMRRRLGDLLARFSQRDGSDLYVLAGYTETGFQFRHLSGKEI